MSPLSPIKRKELVKRLRKSGFDGPYSGGKHSFMKRGALKVRVPNTDIGTQLLRKILLQAGISEKDWDDLS